MRLIEDKASPLYEVYNHIKMDRNVGSVAKTSRDSKGLNSVDYLILSPFEMKYVSRQFPKCSEVGAFARICLNAKTEKRQWKFHENQHKSVYKELKIGAQE